MRVCGAWCVLLSRSRGEEVVRLSWLVGEFSGDGRKAVTYHYIVCGVGFAFVDDGGI